MRPTVQMIEPLQVTMIHTAVSKLCISDDDYRAILSGHYKAASCKELTYIQASRLIDYFKSLGFKIPRRKKYTKGTPSRADFRSIPRKERPTNVVLMPSREQLDMIDALAGKVAWKVADGYERWLKKYIKINRVKTSQEASDAIEGLKGLLCHQGAEV